MTIDREKTPYVSKEELEEFINCLTPIEKRSLMELFTKDDIEMVPDGVRAEFCEEALNDVEAIISAIQDVDNELDSLKDNIKKYYAKPKKK